MIKNTHGLLLGQRHVLRQENDRLVSMSLDERVGVVFPRFFVIDGTLLIPIVNRLRNGVAVLVYFAQVVEHTYNKGTLYPSPFDSIL